MAAATVTTQRLEWNAPAAVTLATADSTAGALVAPANDEATVLILTSSAAATVTVYAGNGIQGVSNLTVTFSGAGTQYVSLESGRYKNVSGANRGKILVKTSAGTLTVGCIALPR